MRVITVPGHLDHRSVDQLAAQLGTWPPEERILVDAHAAEWASPSGFTALPRPGDRRRDSPFPRRTR